MARAKQDIGPVGPMAPKKMPSSAMDRIKQLQQEICDLLDERDSDPDKDWTCQMKEAEIGRLKEALERQAVVNAVQHKPSSKSLTAHWYHVRLSIRGQVSDFGKIMQKMAKSDYVDKQHGLTYVLEQSGAVPDERGINPHAHIRFKSVLPKGRLAYKVKRTTGFDDPAIKVLPHDNVNALRQYMLGNKGSDPVKNAKCAQDKCWRIEEGLKMEYVIKCD